MKLYTLTNRNGLLLKVSDFGAVITELHVPDRAGAFADVVLGFDDLSEYAKSTTPYFGATVGRVANRIEGAVLELDGRRYPLFANNGPHHLHGGERGWDKAPWRAALAESAAGPEIQLSYTSPDGEEGYPGTVHARTTYALTHDDELIVTMQATTDQPTVVNMAHHTYWNLGGHGSGSVEGHELTLHADLYTPSEPVPGADPVPRGAVEPVAGTPFDFTWARPIGQDLRSVGGSPAGFDHNWVVRGEADQLRPVARVKDPRSGRVLELSANQPGVQFYSGKFLDGSLRGKGATYAQYAGLCLESQKFPNAANVPAWREQLRLLPGQTYHHVMVHRFRVE